MILSGQLLIKEKKELNNCEKNAGDKLSSSRILDKLMETIDNEDNFLTED